MEGKINFSREREEMDFSEKFVASLSKIFFEETI
jgi:hypothetical protein